MRVCVRSVQMLESQGIGVARVTATSTRKVRGRPAARISLEVTFEAYPSEDAALVRDRARDTALCFLDVK